MSDLDFHEVTKEEWGAGEIAPSWQGRISRPQYKAGSALLYNMLPREGGGLRRRPGTRWVDTLPAGIVGNTRQAPFTALNGHPFELLIAVVTSTATVYVYDVLSHSLVATLTTNVPAYANGDIPIINWAQQGGETWLFMNGLGAATTTGLPVAKITNAAADGSGAWSCTQPTFTITGQPSNLFSSGCYPGCGEFYAGRLFLSGFLGFPLAQFACYLPPPGTTQTYNNFQITGVAGNAITDGIYYLNNNMNAKSVSWLLAAQNLLAATDKGVWMEYPEAYPTGATFGLKLSASYGSLPNTRGVQVTNVVLHLGADAKSLRSLTLSLYRGYYADENKSAHASHLFSRLVVDFCVILHPEPQVWIMMADGSLIVATVEQEDTGFLVKSVCGFSQQQLGGSGAVQSLCSHCAPYWDEVWMTVKRGNTLTLEYLYLDDIFSTTQAKSYYVDCGQQQIAGSPQKTFSGLPAALNGVRCAAFGDGGVLPRQTPSAGSVTLPVAVQTLNIGYPYYSAFQDLRPILPSKGGLLGLQRKIEKSWMLVYNSMGGYIGQVAPADPLNSPVVNQGGTLVSFWSDMQTYAKQIYGQPPGWVNGFFPIDDNGPVDPNGQIYIDIADPVPFNLVALTTRFSLSEV